jgi:hypothetical protein
MPPNQNDVQDDELRNMDIDEIERVEKYWFGDHATWSHEQLLRLVVCESQLCSDQ